MTPGGDTSAFSFSPWSSIRDEPAPVDRASAGIWQCVVCETDNEKSVRECRVCGSGSGRPMSPLFQGTTTPVKSPERSVSVWQCKACGMENDKATSFCRRCATFVDRPLPSPLQPTPVKANSPATNDGPAHDNTPSPASGRPAAETEAPFEAPLDSVPEDFVLELEKMTLEKSTVEAAHKNLIRKCELLEHDLQMKSADNDWLRGKVEKSEKALADARADALTAQRALIAEKESNRGRKMQQDTVLLKEENARLKDRLENATTELKRIRQDCRLLRDALEEEKYNRPPPVDTSRWQQRINELEREVRTLQQKNQEWAKEKNVLERDASLWRGRLTAAEKKEAELRVKMEEEISGLERLLVRSGTKSFLLHVYKTYPPKNGETLGPLDRASMKKTLRNALVAYHVDKQDVEAYGIWWKIMCHTISQMINGIRQDM